MNLQMRGLNTMYPRLHFNINIAWNSIRYKAIQMIFSTENELSYHQDIAACLEIDDTLTNLIYTIFSMLRRML